MRRGRPTSSPWDCHQTLLRRRSPSASTGFVKPLATDPADVDEPGRGECVEMLGHRLAGHRQTSRQLAEGLRTAVAQAIQQRPARRIGDGLERDGIHVHDDMQLIGCMSTTEG